MTGERTQTALARIETALARIERAGEGAQRSAAEAAQRHATLRAAVTDTLRELDSLIGSGGGQ